MGRFAACFVSAFAGKEKKQAEFQGVLKVLAGSSGASLARIRRDASLLRAAQHLLYHLRSSMRKQSLDFSQAIGPRFITLRGQLGQHLGFRN